MSNSLRPYRFAPLIGMAICGLILITIGVLMTINQATAYGKGLSRHLGSVTINGVSVIVIGVFFFGLGVILILTKRRSRN